MRYAYKMESRYNPSQRCVVSFTFRETVPITGREQLSFVSASQILPMSFNEYQDFLSKHILGEYGVQAETVKRIGPSIQHAVERYFTEHGLLSRLNGYKWEFNWVKDKQANAWCIPGGKVVDYTGILAATKDENGGGERMTQVFPVEMGGLTLDAALSQNQTKTNNLFLAP